MEEDGQTGTYTGNDGRVYSTVLIRGMEILSENLSETRFRNGDMIPLVDNSSEWSDLTTAGRCWYNNEPEI